MSEPDDEIPADEDEDEADWAVCIRCHRDCWPDELELLICHECRNSEIARAAIRKVKGE